MLASANRDKILNALGHEFGHYSKEDNKTGSRTKIKKQIIQNFDI